MRRITTPFKIILGVLTLVALTSSAHAQKFSDWSAPINLGENINSPATDGCPFISKDRLSLYFASNRPGTTGQLDLYVSERASKNDPWGAPHNLGITINGTANEFCPMLTTNQRMLFFVSNRPGGCGGDDLYVSIRRNKRDNFAWESPVNLGCQVNSPQNDFTPSIFEDESGDAILYFSSNRPGGPGGTDIYASALLDEETLTFDTPIMVPGLNTEFNDQRPNVRRDGLEIFFDSDRHGSVGSFDLWTATRESTSDNWSTPTNLGFVVNSAAVEGRPSLSFDATTLYFMSSRLGGSGGVDLYVTTRAKLPRQRQKNGR